MYAKPFIIVGTSYALAAISKRILQTPFFILFVHEIGCQTGLICQWFKDMCATWQHVTIIICAAYEHAQFYGIARLIHVEYGIDVLFPRYKAHGVSQYPSQSVSLTAHSHLSGLMVKPCLRSQRKMVANSLMR